MSNSEVKLTLSFGSAESIVNHLRSRREEDSYALRPYAKEGADRWVDEDGRIKVHSVKHAEKTLEKRAELADRIFDMTGIRPTEDLDDVAEIRDARQRLDAQEAADKVAAEVETPHLSSV